MVSELGVFKRHCDRGQARWKHLQKQRPKAPQNGCIPTVTYIYIVISVIAGQHSCSVHAKATNH
jgi:hypothetical protein